MNIKRNIIFSLESRKKNGINYIDMVGEDYVEVDSFHLWLQDLIG